MNNEEDKGFETRFDASRASFFCLQSHDSHRRRGMGRVGRRREKGEDENRDHDYGT